MTDEQINVAIEAARRGEKVLMVMPTFQSAHNLRRTIQVKTRPEEYRMIEVVALGSPPFRLRNCIIVDEGVSCYQFNDERRDALLQEIEAFQARSRRSPNAKV